MTNEGQPIPHVPKISDLRALRRKNGVNEGDIAEGLKPFYGSWVNRSHISSVERGSMGTLLGSETPFEQNYLNVLLDIETRRIEEIKGLLDSMNPNPTQ